MFAWGAGTSGQLGTGHCSDSTTPVACELPHRPLSVACGGSHVVASTAGGKLYGWGLAKALPRNEDAPDDTVTTDTRERAIPVPLEVSKFWSGRKIVSLAAGWAHSAFVDSKWVGSGARATQQRGTAGDGHWGTCILPCSARLSDAALSSSHTETRPATCSCTPRRDSRRGK